MSELQDDPNIRIYHDFKGEVKITLYKDIDVDPAYIFKLLQNLPIHKLRKLTVKIKDGEEITAKFIPALISRLTQENKALSFEKMPDGKFLPHMSTDQQEEIHLETLGHLFTLILKSNGLYLLEDLFPSSMYETLTMFSESELNYPIELDKYRLLDLYERLMHPYPTYNQEVIKIKQILPIMNWEQLIPPNKEIVRKTMNDLHQAFDETHFKEQKDKVVEDLVKKIKPWIHSLHHIALGMNKILPIEIIQDRKPKRLFRWRDVKMFTPQELSKMIQK
jgi:hypothetical protein